MIQHGKHLSRDSNFPAEEIHVNNVLCMFYSKDCANLARCDFLEVLSCPINT